VATNGKTDPVVDELFTNEEDRETYAELFADPEAWCDRLAEIIASIQSQMALENAHLAEREAELLAEGGAAAQAELEAEQRRVRMWKAKANAILLRAQARRPKVKRLSLQAQQQRWDDSNAAKVQALLQAIDQHRVQVLEELLPDDDGPLSADEELWRCAEQLRAGELDLPAELQRESA